MSKYSRLAWQPGLALALVRKGEETQPGLGLLERGEEQGRWPLSGGHGLWVGPSGEGGGFMENLKCLICLKCNFNFFSLP